jgi:hypothetical protein
LKGEDREKLENFGIGNWGMGIGCWVSGIRFWVVLKQYGIEKVQGIEFH